MLPTEQQKPEPAKQPEPIATDNLQWDDGSPMEWDDGTPMQWADAETEVPHASD